MRRIAQLMCTAGTGNRRLMAVAIFGLFTVSLAMPVHAEIVISDGTFNNSDWTQTATVDIGPPIFTATATQSLTGGNPGAFRDMIHTWGSPTEAQHVTVDHMYTSLTYNPNTQGAIGSINYSEDGIIISPSSGGIVGRGMDIFQDGVVYRTGVPGDGFYALTDTTWKTFTLSNLTAADFTSTLGTHPNFSAAGDPIQFGYLRSNGFTGGVFTFEHGIDNWTVTISPAAVPEPFSMVPTGTAALVGLGYWWRRRRRADA